MKLCTSYGLGRHLNETCLVRGVTAQQVIGCLVELDASLIARPASPPPPLPGRSAEQPPADDPSDASAARCSSPRRESASEITPETLRPVVVPRAPRNRRAERPSTAARSPISRTSPPRDPIRSTPARRLRLFADSPPRRPTSENHPLHPSMADQRPLPARAREHWEGRAARRRTAPSTDRGWASSSSSSSPAPLPLPPPIPFIPRRSPSPPRSSPPLPLALPRRS